MTRCSTGSVLVMLVLGVMLLSGNGCSQDSQTRTFTQEDDVVHEGDHGHDHAHDAHGPHGGHLIELGGEDYHAELTFDAATRKLTVYLLESDAKTAMPVAAESVSVRLNVGSEKQEIRLAASPLAEDGEGKSSRFVQGEDALPEAIQDEEGLEGEVVVMIGEKSYRGPITHDHDHGHDHP